LWLTPCFAQPAVVRRSSPPHRAAPPRGASPQLRLRRPHRPSWFPRRLRCVLVPRVHEAEPPSSISCAAPPPAAAHRRRPPQSPRHPPLPVFACVLRRRIEIQRAGLNPTAPLNMRASPTVGSRSDAPDQPRCPQATAAARSRSNRSRSSQPGQLGQTPPAPAVLRKPPSFPKFTDIPFHPKKFLTDQSFFLYFSPEYFRIFTD
jgi:hypothetical protein